METSCKVCGGQHLTGWCTENRSPERNSANISVAEMPKSYEDIPTEIVAELQALSPAEAAYCTEGNTSIHSPFEIFPELQSFIDSLDDELRPMAEKIVEYHRKNNTYGGSIGNVIYHFQQGDFIKTGDYFKDQDMNTVYKKELSNNPIFLRMVEKERGLRALMKRIDASKKEAETARERETQDSLVTSTSEKVDEPSPEQLLRIKQAESVLPDIELKLQAYRAAGYPGEVAKYEIQRKMWQAIIDNKGREEPYKPERQTSTQRQRN